MKLKIEIDTNISEYTSDVINILKAINEQFAKVIGNEEKEQSDVAED